MLPIRRLLRPGPHFNESHFGGLPIPRLAGRVTAYTRIVPCIADYPQNHRLIALTYREVPVGEHENPGFQKLFENIQENLWKNKSLTPMKNKNL